MSDTRTPRDDKSGQRISELLNGNAHVVETYEIVRDERDEISARVHRLLADEEIQVIVVNGGTGLAPRDTTHEALQPLFDKEIPGFGELFRQLSYAEIGSAAMLSRATAGVARGKILISLPGSTGAVDLAMKKLVLPELGHMVSLAGGRGHE